MNVKEEMKLEVRREGKVAKGNGYKPGREVL